jgi:hypothetical protein
MIFLILNKFNDYSLYANFDDRKKLVLEFECVLNAG